MKRISLMNLVGWPSSKYQTYQYLFVTWNILFSLTYAFCYLTWFVFLNKLNSFRNLSCCFISETCKELWNVRTEKIPTLIKFSNLTHLSFKSWDFLFSIYLETKRINQEANFAISVYFEVHIACAFIYLHINFLLSTPKSYTPLWQGSNMKQEATLSPSNCRGP